MPKFGCYRTLIVEPDRTWTADYIAHKGGQVEFWNRAPIVGEPDDLVAVASLGLGQTIAKVSSTEVVQVQPNVYEAIFTPSEPQEIYDYASGAVLASPSE